VAAALVMLAVLVPAGAWYAAGRHEVEREAAERLAAPERAAQEAARRLATALVARLDALIAAETPRPYYHYQNLYHDPRGASEGVSVVPSPLARGSNDPLIRAYFQIDSRGRVSMPTLNDELREKALQPDAERQRALRRSLGDAVPASLALLAADRRTPAQAAAPAPPAQRMMKAAVPESLDPRQRQVEMLDPSSYAQNVQASQLYSRLKGSSPNAAQSPMLPTATRKGSVAIELGPLRWHTLPIGGQPALAALRVVSSPQGRWLQGFALAPEALAQVTGGASLPARLAERPPAGTAAAPVGETGWWVVVEPAAAGLQARTEAEELRARFRRDFAFGMAAALLAGAGVVWLVWQSERLARQRAQFAAAAAHELRTPLTGLRMHGEMLAEGLGNPARAREYARRVAAEAERLGRVVENVLSFTRLERGQLRVRLEPGDLGAVVHAAAERQRPALEAAGVTLSLVIAKSLPQVRFDPEAVAHIVQNLLDNAERHTRESDDRRVDLSLGRSTHGVELAVRDYGPGAALTRRGRSFRRRGDDGGSASTGLGLGLVLVDALAKAHGGTVEVESPKRGGARFRVTLPERA